MRETRPVAAGLVSSPTETRPKTWGGASRVARRWPAHKEEPAVKPETEVKVHNAVQVILEMFRTGQLPEAVAETVIHRQRHDVPSARWSLSNQLLMFANGTKDARGYDQWRQVGRYVKKGAKAFYILAPRTKTVKEVDEEGNEVERTVLIGFIAVPVFRYEDTEGEPLPPVDYRPPTFPPLWDVARRLGVRVDYVPFLEGQTWRGRYQWGGEKRILLATHDVDTFFHELAHAVHHTFRELRGGQHPDQEVVAETVSAVLCHLYGLSGYIWHGYKYIERYAQDGNPARAVMRVLADVERVLTMILEMADEPVPAVPAPAADPVAC